MISSVRPFSIEIYVPDGFPDGLRTVEKSNWVGKAIVCPRALFPENKTRKEYSRTGVYLLAGPDENAGVQRIYVGEGDPVRPRLESHYISKDFWTLVVAFTSKDENLNKADVQFLEARLVALAKEANRSIVDNGNSPQLPSLSDSARSRMEVFLEEMLVIYPLLGITAFEKPQVNKAGQKFYYIKSKGKVSASGCDMEQGFLVTTNSTVSLEESPSAPAFIKNIRDGLKAKKILIEENSVLKFAQDYVFDSPSTAAGVVLGRTANGRTEWKDESGMTLKSVQAANSINDAS